MKYEYVIDNVGELSRIDNSLVFISDSIRYIPIESVESISIYSKIIIHSSVYSLLSKYNIKCHFFSFYGFYNGSYISNSFKDSNTLFNQVLCINDSAKHLEVCKSLLYANLTNSLNLVKYYTRKYKNLDLIINKFNIDSINLCSCVNELLLLEAINKKNYYSIFKEMISNQNFSFTSRVFNPPDNRINALMSYGYSLLYTTVLNSLINSKLYHSLSFIHSRHKTSIGLVFDISDIFKPIIDRLIIRLIRTKVILEDHFSFVDNKCYLNKDGKILFYNEYHSLLLKTLFVKRYNKNISYKQLINKEIHNLSNFINNNEKYKPFIMKF